MAGEVFATKGNLLNAKKTLALCSLGYELLDRKRNVLIRELLSLIDSAKALRGTFEDAFREAYEALEDANISLGFVDGYAKSVDLYDGISVMYRSVMGVELPKISAEKSKLDASFGMYRTNSQLDLAFIRFERAKELSLRLAETETSIFRLADAVKRVQKTANSLRNVMIPRYKAIVKQISDSLEEKEREEFSQLKVIKSAKNGTEA